MRQAKDLFMLQIVLGLLAIGIALFLWERFPAFKWVLATIFGLPLVALLIVESLDAIKKREVDLQIILDRDANLKREPNGRPVTSQQPQAQQPQAQQPTKALDPLEEYLLGRLETSKTPTVTAPATPSAPVPVQPEVKKQASTNSEEQVPACPAGARTLAQLWDCTPPSPPKVKAK